MREHHALRVAGGTAGVGQRGEIGRRIDATNWGVRRVLLQEILQPVQVLSGSDVRVPRFISGTELAERGLPQEP